MTHPPLLVAVVLSLVLSACGTQPKVLTQHGNGQLELLLGSGSYSCEDGVSVQVEREIRDQTSYRVNIGWNGNRYRLERDPSYSGLPRFEDASNGLVWIDLPSKGLLLDSKAGKPLANECRPI